MQIKNFMFYLNIITYFESIFCSFHENSIENFIINDPTKNNDTNDIKSRHDHNEVILIEYEATKKEEHEFVFVIVKEYLKKYIEITNKNIFNETKYSISATREKSLDFNDFFYYLLAAELTRNGSNEIFSESIDNDKLEINYLLELDENYFDNFIASSENIFCFDNCIKHHLDFGYIMAELKKYLPEELKINRNYIILLLEFDNLNLRNLWNEQKFESLYNNTLSQNFNYFSFDSFELGTVYIPNSNENYVYTFDKFIIDKTTEFDKVNTRQISQPISVDTFIKKNDFKKIFKEIFHNKNKLKDSNDDFEVISENENKIEISATFKINCIDLLIEATLGYEEEIVAENQCYKNFITVRVYINEAKINFLFFNLREVYGDNVKFYFFNKSNNIKKSDFKDLVPQIFNYENEIEKRILKTYNFNGDRFLWN